MDRINRICNHPRYRKNLDAIRRLEQDRIFCRHDPSHFLDVARLAYIEVLERGLSIPREELYAAALLHDIGRHLQYMDGIPHEIASAAESEEMLRECGFSDEERAHILSAIRLHRTKEARKDDGLAGLIYRADKASRMCLFCEARKQCDWSEEKKNLVLTK